MSSFLPFLLFVYQVTPFYQGNPSSESLSFLPVFPSSAKRLENLIFSRQNAQTASACSAEAVFIS